MLSYSIQLERELAAAPDLIWRMLSEPKLVSEWLMETDIAPLVGYRFTFRARPTPVWDGVVHCEVREVRPAERLVYSWVGAADMPETIVNWSINPAKSGTRLAFNHTGFRGLKYGLIGRFLKRGWQDMIDRKLPSALAQQLAPEPSALSPPQHNYKLQAIND
jgi:uncharacterized protein YndB with AHSA1/START domain